MPGIWGQTCRRDYLVPRWRDNARCHLHKGKNVGTSGFMAGTMADYNLGSLSCPLPVLHISSFTQCTLKVVKTLLYSISVRLILITLLQAASFCASIFSHSVLYSSITGACQSSDRHKRLIQFPLREKEQRRERESERRKREREKERKKGRRWEKRGEIRHNNAETQWEVHWSMNRLQL